MTTRVTEDWLIAEIRERFGALAGRQSFDGLEIAVSMSDLDDAAVLSLDGTRPLVVASDYVRGRQFDLFRSGHLDYFDLGFYLIGANLSDLAAMGARPVGATIILRYPEDLTRDDAIQMIDGIREAATAYGPCPLLGGDSGGATDLVLAATALGHITGRPLLRSNAQLGDRVYVIGTPGRAAAAQAIAAAAIHPHQSLPRPLFDQLLNAWKRPVPLIEAGSCLSKSNLRIACQDTSDGLKTTLRQIGEASGCSMLVSQEQLPQDPLLQRAAQLLQVDYTEFLFRPSVDFGLVFTLAAECDPRSLLPHPISNALTCIGEVIEASRPLMLRRRDGTVTPRLPAAEYRQ